MSSDAQLARQVDAARLGAWQCGICMEGMGTGGLFSLVSAHQATVNADGRHVLHVFHRRCLKRWRQQGQENSGRCPTCREPLDTLPAIGRWVDGKTTLSAPMALAPAPAPTALGAHPYLVCQ